MILTDGYYLFITTNYDKVSDDVYFDSKGKLLTSNLSALTCHFDKYSEYFVEHLKFPGGVKYRFEEVLEETPEEDYCKVAEVCRESPFHEYSLLSVEDLIRYNYDELIAYIGAIEDNE